MTITIYHNPRCTKSRQTLALLQEKGVEPEVVEYLKTPPSKSQLKKILALLQMQPRDLVRKKEKQYKGLGLDDPSLSEGQLLDAMVENPILIERPSVLSGGEAVQGCPPENVLEIL